MKQTGIPIAFFESMNGLSVLKRVAEKRSVPVSVQPAVPSVILMHTYRLSVLPHDKNCLLDRVSNMQGAFLSHDHSNTCYYIIAADDAKEFLSVVASLNMPYTMVSVAELRKKFSKNHDYKVSGNWKLITLLLSVL